MKKKLEFGEIIYLTIVGVLLLIIYLTIVGVLLFCAGGLIGESRAKRNMCVEAEKAGVGEWYINKDKEKAWRWLPRKRLGSK